MEWELEPVTEDIYREEETQKGKDLLIENLYPINFLINRLVIKSSLFLR